MAFRPDSRYEAYRSRLKGRTHEVHERLLVEVRPHNAVRSDLKVIDIGVGHGDPVHADHFMAAPVRDRASWVGLGVLPDLVTFRWQFSAHRPEYRIGQFVPYLETTERCLLLIGDPEHLRETRRRPI